MKNFLRCIILLLIVNQSTLSQENRFTIRNGIGYYMDVFTTDDGPIIWIEGGLTLKTGFILNLRLSMASIDWVIQDGTFEGYKTIQLRQMADITFSKPIKLSGNHSLEPGIGFKLKREYLLKPNVEYIYSSGNYYQSTSYSEVFYEVGLTICLDYYYQFKNKVYIGVRADSNIIWALGFEGLTISPLFGFRF